MRLLALNAQALFALFLVLGTQALPQTSVGQPLKRDEDGYEAKSNCDPWRSEEDSKRLWDDSQAGVIGDDFINKHGVSGWIQNMHKEIFNEPVASWNCYDPGSDCEVDRKCSEYADKNMEGAYYLSHSIQNAVGALRSARHYLLEETVKSSLNVPRITSHFRKKASDTKPNVLVLIATTFGMLGGIAAPVAPAAGAAGFASGMLAFMGNLNPPKPDESEDLEGKLNTMVLQTFEMLLTQVDDIIGALVGEEGKNQELIPKEMTTQSFDNAVMNALGDGQWLSDDSAAGVKESMKAAYHKIKQALAWMMIHHGRKGFWFIDTVGKDGCGNGSGDKPEEFWHDEAEGCVKLMEIKEASEDKVEFEYTAQEIHDRLWGNDDEYNLDVKKTFENSYKCWVENGGKVGDVDLEDIKDSEIPKCWFGIPVVRGGLMADFGTGDVNYFHLEEFEGQHGEKRWFGKFEDDGSLEMKY